MQHSCDPPQDPIQTCRQGVDLLRKERDIDLTGALGAWLERRPCPPRTGPAQRIDPASLPFAPMTDRSVAGASPSSVIIEGVAALQAAHRATARSADGYRPRLYLVQHDLDGALDALATGIDHEILTDPRIEWCLGARAAESLADALSRRLDAALPSHVVRAPGVAPITPPVEQIVQAARAEQERTHVALRARVAERYAAHGAAHWHHRLSARCATPPRRILIPTSRHSTFVHHAAHDLADAFCAHDCEALVLEEPTHHDKLSSVAYLRAFDDFAPDLVVLINFTRANLAHVIPETVPVVSWIQDRLRHLFDERVGRAMTRFDHVWGHLHPVLFTNFAYPRDRAHWGVVPASERTFHGGPVDEHIVRDHACDIAYASHQSETPDAFHERVRRELGAQGPAANVLDAVRSELTRLCESAEDTDVHARLDTITTDALRDANTPQPDPRFVAILEATYTRPLAERIWRHQMLAWAAHIADAHDLRLHIHGNGWDAHPTLARFARPALTHDEALRAAYRHARVHLHASLATNAHQRVFECALSAGLMLRRGPSPDVSLAKKCVQKLVHERYEPTASRPHRTGTCLEYDLALPPITDTTSPDAWRTPDVARMRRMKGKPAPDARPDGLYEARFRVMDADIEQGFALIPEIPLWTFPDYAFPNADETLFRTRDELEAMILRGVRDDDWRESTARAHRAVSLRWHTYERTAHDMLAFVGARMGAQAQRSCDAEHAARVAV